VSVGEGRWAKPATYATYDYRPPSPRDSVSVGVGRCRPTAYATYATYDYRPPSSGHEDQPSPFDSVVGRSPPTTDLINEKLNVVLLPMVTSHRGRYCGAPIGAPQ
jgi:hypothetical protein